MKLRVTAVPGVPVRDPQRGYVQGQPPPRVAVRLNGIGEWEPTAEPAEFDNESVAGHEIRGALQRGELLPADEDTAKAAGVAFPQPVVKTAKGGGDK